MPNNIEERWKLMLTDSFFRSLGHLVLSSTCAVIGAYHFPVPCEDVYCVVRYFLQADVLKSYNINPERIAWSGDSAGGNLAAAVAQQLQQDPGKHIHLKIQALIYPVLQALDFNTPSYQQNQHMPILPHLLHTYGSFWRENPGHLIGPHHWLADTRASLLLVPDKTLRLLPKTYVLTCEYDVLRDDGLMYVTRLRKAGVDVTHEHYPSGFHGALMFVVWPTDFETGYRMMDNYVTWLKQNL